MRNIILFMATGAALALSSSMTSCKDKSSAPVANTPEWLETDSAAAISKRTAADFSLDREEMLRQVRAKYPEVTDADLDTFITHHYVEAMIIDGELRFHRKSPRNLGLLAPSFNGQNPPRGSKASEQRIAYVDSVLDFYAGKNKKGLAHKVKYRFTIDVPGNEAIEGDTLRVWMPVPLDNDRCNRQHDIHILDAYPADYILSGTRSEHNSIYFEAPAPAPGDTAHFEYTAEFVTSGKFRSAEDIMKNIKPYNTESPEYKRFTSFEAPHIVRLDSLAHSIVGNETNPFIMSEKVFDYIINRYPWAGAREYSTIPCIPEYVVTEGHGDCGQVSLLYISLMRTLGIPARWESGWMLHPGEVNLHDWAQVYFEGIGWLPVDVSFGRYTGAKRPETVTFYSHGIDAHRLAANTAVGKQFYPKKKFVRSETVDFQVGEVETGKGNLYYPAWNYEMQVISATPVEEEK
ncbi:MAG: transglutaminase-like domain-containing protein [Muribaculaceae bacterium]|nr:transglutaminase-like domain-containing protein [Muribaculaceae bacterium]